MLQQNSLKFKLLTFFGDITSCWRKCRKLTDKGDLYLNFKSHDWWLSLFCCREWKSQSFFLVFIAQAFMTRVVILSGALLRSVFKLFRAWSFRILSLSYITTRVVQRSQMSHKSIKLLRKTWICSLSKITSGHKCLINFISSRTKRYKLSWSCTVCPILNVCKKEIIGFTIVSSYP